MRPQELLARARSHLRCGLLFSLLFFIVSQGPVSTIGDVTLEVWAPAYVGPDSVIIPSDRPMVISLDEYFTSLGRWNFTVIAGPEITTVLDDNRLIVSSGGFIGESNVTLIARSSLGVWKQTIPFLSYPNIAASEIRLHNAPSWMRYGL